MQVLDPLNKLTGSNMLIELLIKILNPETRSSSGLQLTSPNFIPTLTWVKPTHFCNEQVEEGYVIADRSLVGPLEPFNRSRLSADTGVHLLSYPSSFSHHITPHTHFASTHPPIHKVIQSNYRSQKQILFAVESSTIYY